MDDWTTIDADSINGELYKQRSGLAFILSLMLFVFCFCIWEIKEHMTLACGIERRNRGFIPMLRDSVKESKDFAKNYLKFN